MLTLINRWPHAARASALRREQDESRHRATKIYSPFRLTHVESAPLAATMESARTHGPQQQGAALMKRTTKYVGLDVHQASTVVSVREEGGRVIARGVVPTEAHALTEFVHGMRGTVHVVFEEGTQAQWLHDLMAPLVDRVVVCD